MHIIDTSLRIQKNRKRSTQTQHMIVTSGNRKQQEAPFTSPPKKKIKVKAGNEGRGKEESSRNINKIMN